MRQLPTWGIVAIGAGLGLLGWFGIFLTAIRVIPPSLWLLLLLWTVHIAGLILGLTGVGQYVVRRKRKP